MINTLVLRACFLCLTLLVACSCNSDVANRYYSATRYPAKASNEIELLSTEPARPYEVIADFQSRSDSPESLRRKAAKIGADAVIVTTLGGRYSSSEKWADQQGDRTLYTRIVGTAIKYK